jgi:hypothetical protein
MGKKRRILCSPKFTNLKKIRFNAGEEETLPEVKEERKEPVVEQPAVEEKAPKVKKETVKKKTTKTTKRPKTTKSKTKKKKTAE